MRTVLSKSIIMQRFLLIAGVVILSLQLIIPRWAEAQSIVINDCNGFTRAVKQTDPGETSKVQVDVSSASGTPAQGATVSLTNVVTGEIVTGTVQNGSVSFDGVAPGIYSLQVGQPGLVVGSIWIGSATASAALATGAGVGAIVLAGGAAVGIVAGVDSVTGGGGSGNSNKPIMPTPTPAPQPTSKPPAPKPTPCPVCNPDAEPTPINSFFDSQQKQPATQQAQVLSPYR